MAMLARRLVTIPVFVLLWATCVAAAPVWLTLAIASDAFRRSRWLALRCGALMTFYLTLEVFGIVLCGGTWLWGRTARPDAERWARVNFDLEAWWGATLFWAIERIFGLDVQVTDHADLSSGPFLLFPRHTSAAEALLIGSLVSRASDVQLRYVFKKEMAWSPCVDMIGHRVPNLFIDRTSPDSQKEIERARALGENLGTRGGVLIYPEGMRFTESKRKRRIQSYVDEGNHAMASYATSLRFVLPPKTGGPLALLEESGDADVIICGHVGLECFASLARMASGELIHQSIQIGFRRIPRAKIPGDREDQVDWLYEEWKRLDQWVADYYA